VLFVSNFRAQHRSENFGCNMICYFIPHVHVPALHQHAAASLRGASATTASPLWPDKMEVEVRQGQERVEVALIAEVAPK